MEYCNFHVEIPWHKQLRSHFLYLPLSWFSLLLFFSISLFPFLFSFYFSFQLLHLISFIFSHLSLTLTPGSSVTFLLLFSLYFPFFPLFAPISLFHPLLHSLDLIFPFSFHFSLLPTLPSPSLPLSRLLPHTSYSSSVTLFSVSSSSLSLLLFSSLPFIQRPRYTWVELATVKSAAW